MTNAELIAALRYCAEHEGCDYYIAKDCPRESTWVCGADCEQILMRDSADALEAADKRIAELAKQAEHTDQVDAMIFATHLKQAARIAELEAKMPKEGEWIYNDRPCPDFARED